MSSTCIPAILDLKGIKQWITVVSFFFSDLIQCGCHGYQPAMLLLKFYYVD